MDRGGGRATKNRIRLQERMESNYGAVGKKQKGRTWEARKARKDLRDYPSQKLRRKVTIFKNVGRLGLAYWEFQ